MTMKKKVRPLKTAVLLTGMLAFVACAQDSARIDLTTYAPVIDVGGQGYDIADYNKDLDECRALGVRVQAAYEAQQKKEREDAQKAAFVGALAGAVIGHSVGRNNDYHTGRSATAGALYGGAIGGAVGAENLDYTRDITKFGPTSIVDRCMTDRGYKILSVEGFGGGRSDERPSSLFLPCQSSGYLGDCWIDSVCFSRNKDKAA